MAYLSQFENDIYISSAPVDNLTSPSEDRGWIDLFHQSLDIELSRRVGRVGAIKTWRNIAEFKLIEPQIRHAIEESALFLALISPGYLQSGFCQTELRTFFEKARESRFGLTVESSSRIFPVLLQRMPMSAWPEEIADLGIMGFPFYANDVGWSMRETGHPADPRGQNFQEQIRRLAHEIFQTLQILRGPLDEEPAKLPESIPIAERAASVERHVAESSPILSVVDATIDDAFKMPKKESPAGVFICYRRGESTPYAGRLYDRLSARFGEDRVFMDLDTIEPGDDFVEVITDYVSSCSILIALINKEWLEVKDDEGRPRLHNPEDFVSLEISVALERGIRVIPVLVQGASMPRPQDLPEPLAKLSRRNALELSDSRWSYDVSRLIQVLAKDLDRT